MSIQATVRLWLFPQTGSARLRSIMLRLNARGSGRSAGFAGFYAVTLNYNRVICSMSEKDLVSGWKCTIRAHLDCRQPHLTL